jgi:hypothetical protein
VRRVLALALCAGLALAPSAVAHGGGEHLGGEVDQGLKRRHVTGLASFSTKLVHHRIHVRVCLQRRTSARHWKTRACGAKTRKNKRSVTTSITVGCKTDGVYRVRVWGHTRSKAGELDHRVSGTSDSYGIDCR